VALQDAWFNDTLIKALSNDIALDLSDTTPGAYKGALFEESVGSGSPNWNQTNPAYGSSPWNADEASGPGYASGGLDMTVLSFADLAATNKVGWTLDELTWTGATFAAAGLLIYVPSLSNKAVIFRAFGQSYDASDGDYSVAWAESAWRTVLRSAA
jgi:hypothetical protein